MARFIMHPPSLHPLSPIPYPALTAQTALTSSSPCASAVTWLSGQNSSLPLAGVHAALRARRVGVERLDVRREPVARPGIGEDAAGGSTGAQPLAARIIVAISALVST